MSNLSLQASIRTCKVDQGWANKIESDRFFNPELMMCPVWNGRDLTGRKVCPDSFWTKREGCNSAEDRITVENGLRPQYMEYITLDAAGIQGAFDSTGPYSGDRTRDGFPPNSQTRTQSRQEFLDYTGNFGLDFNQVYPGCASLPYARAMAMQNQGQRSNEAMTHGYQSNQMRNASGNRFKGY
jgi:hypothetical protein